MGFIQKTLESVSLPKIVKVRRYFPEDALDNVEENTLERIRGTRGYKNLRPGQKIAVTAGSRAFANIVEVTRGTVRAIKETGAEPFIVPAMGSHGGATAAGQRALLAGIGVTEASVGAPIISSMAVDRIGDILNNRPIYLDRHANAADGIVLINRVKAHTSFRGKYESGLMKMMAIGLGKQKGAQFYHQSGIDFMAETVEAVGKAMVQLKNIVFGVGVVENSYGKIGILQALDCDEILEREPELLSRAKQYLPRLFCRNLDVLSVQSIGKNISGTGMDCNVIGRFYNPHITDVDVHITRIAALDLTAESHGNAVGAGFGDIITKRLFDKMIFEQTYPNALTSTAMELVRIPMILSTDKMVLRAAVKSSKVPNQNQVRMALIEHTKNMYSYFISEPLTAEAKQHNLEILSEPFEIPFDGDDRLTLDYGYAAAVR
ncbi:MAG: DUF362 domain-containing protein [Peptococcaceae bacterium]|nr:DUF362 domain-containing protein [Peptococcaceae bacterium]